jgi:hypothetical protein
LISLLEQSGRLPQKRRCSKIFTRQVRIEQFGNFPETFQYVSGYFCEEIWSLKMYKKQDGQSQACSTEFLERKKRESGSC